MQSLKDKLVRFLAKKLDQYRRQQHKVKLEVSTKDHQSTIRDYKIVAIPRTLEQKEYDVRIERKKRFGSNVEVIRHVWSRGYLDKFVHENS